MQFSIHNYIFFLFVEALTYGEGSSQYSSHNFFWDQVPIHQWSLRLLY